MYFFGNKTEGQGGLGGGGGTAHLTSHESILLGYLPIRDDFEVEYDNEAESLVSHLIHLPNSSQSGGGHTRPLISNIFPMAFVTLIKADPYISQNISHRPLLNLY